MQLKDHKNHDLKCLPREIKYNKTNFFKEKMKKNFNESSNFEEKDYLSERKRKIRGNYIEELIFKKRNSSNYNFISIIFRKSLSPPILNGDMYSSSISKKSSLENIHEKSEKINSLRKYEIIKKNHIFNNCSKNENANIIKNENFTETKILENLKNSEINYIKNIKLETQEKNFDDMDSINLPNKDSNLGKNFYIKNYQTPLLKLNLKKLIITESNQNNKNVFQKTPDATYNYLNSTYLNIPSSENDKISSKNFLFNDYNKKKINYNSNTMNTSGDITKNKIKTTITSVNNIESLNKNRDKKNKTQNKFEKTISLNLNFNLKLNLDINRDNDPIVYRLTNKKNKLNLNQCKYQNTFQNNFTNNILLNNEKNHTKNKTVKLNKTKSIFSIKNIYINFKHQNSKKPGCVTERIGDTTKDKVKEEKNFSPKILKIEKIKQNFIEKNKLIIGKGVKNSLDLNNLEKKNNIKKEIIPILNEIKSNKNISNKNIKQNFNISENKIIIKYQRMKTEKSLNNFNASFGYNHLNKSKKDHENSNDNSNINNNFNVFTKNYLKFLNVNSQCKLDEIESVNDKRYKNGGFSDREKY